VFDRPLRLVTALSVGSVTSMREYVSEKRRASKVAANERVVWWHRLAADSHSRIRVRRDRRRRER